MTIFRALANLSVGKFPLEIPTSPVQSPRVGLKRFDSFRYGLESWACYVLCDENATSKIILLGVPQSNATFLWVTMDEMLHSSFFYIYLSKMEINISCGCFVSFTYSTLN